jgi:4-hydroxy-tetrahydrodipicolinate synthase
MQILSNTNSFSGIFTALVTPFHPDGTVDRMSYEALIDSQLAAGVRGVVPCGTTGEAPTLVEEEKVLLVEIAARKCKGRALVVAGTGSNDTKKTIRASLEACKAGADALLIVTPYYNKPSQLGMEAHFRAIADTVSVPIILYNVPGRTGVSLTSTTVAKLAQHPRIIGIKEATGNLSLFTEMRTAVAERAPDKAFYFLSGDDPTFWPFLACGGDGVISVASNVVPNCLRVMHEDWNEGRVGTGLALHDKLSAFFNLLFVEANPVPVKALLHRLGKMNSIVRPPLAEVLPENAAKLFKAWDALLPHLREDKPRENIHG